MVARSPGHTVKLGLSLYADAIKASEHYGLNVGQYVERAVSAQLERDRHSWKVADFREAQREAARARRAAPSAEDFGLPRDFGIAPAFRPQK